MDTADLLGIVLESMEAEKAKLLKAAHPHVIAAHRAAIRDFDDRLLEVRRSNRLSDKIRIEA